MPSWWSKSSSKEVKKKKTTKENVLGSPNRLVSRTEQRDGTMREGGKQTISNTISQEGSRSRVESLSTSPSCKVPNFDRFTDGSHAQPLPVPVLSCAPSGVIASTSMLEKHGKAHLHLPLPEPFHLCRKPDATDVSAPDSSMSSPCRSPMRVVCPEQILTAAFLAPKSYPDVNFLGSGQCSSSGSGQTSGHNSMGGDMSGHLLWPQGRGSTECSPIPSPRLASPGSGSRIHSRAVSPRHPRAGAPAPELPTSRHDEGKMLSHPLPLPPINIYNASPFSSNNSTPHTLSSISRSPGRTDSPASPGSGWKKGKLIGRGTFGHVYVGFNSDSGEMCAMKEVTLFSDDAKSKESAKQLGQEISLLRRLRHPNIVQYYGCEVIDDKFYIYLEYVAGGSIHKLLQEYGQLGEAAIRSFTQQILSGLAYLHAKNTVHRDIKGANILVDPTGRVKLADFGMAKHISGQACPFSLKGSPYWMAPEVIRNTNGCNLAVDIWSLGCTVLEMATSKPPWSEFEGIAAMFKIGNSKQLPPIPDHLSEVGKDFIRHCLQRDPSQRPTAVKLLQHPFVRNVVPVVKSILSSEFIDRHTDVSIGGSFRGVGHAGNFSPLGTGQMIHQLKGARTARMISGTHPTGIMSCPVSPVGSPRLNPGSLHHSNRKKSASPISSPITISGSSTPLTGGNGFTPFNQLKPLGFLHECYSNKSRPNHPLGPTPKLDLYHGGQKGSTVSRKQGTSESEICTHQLGSASHVNLREPNDKQFMCVNHVSHQLLREHALTDASLDLSCSSPILAHTCGT